MLASLARRLTLLALISAFQFFSVSAFATDISITAASVLASGAATKDNTHLAGETITAGQVVYLDSGTNKYKLADANGATPLTVVVGIALNGAANGQPITIVKTDPDFTLGGTVAAGAVVILSANAGGIAPVADSTTGWIVTVLGIGTGSNHIVLKPLAVTAAVP